MAKSATAQPPEKTRVKPAPKQGNFLLVSLFRLLLLGVSGSLAAIAGMAIAQFYPDKTQEPPLVETALRQSQHWLSQFQPIPQQINQLSSPTPIVPPQASPPGALPSAAAPALPLSSGDRTKLQGEAAALQQRLQAIQQQLGTASPSPGGQFNTQPIVAPAVPSVTATQGKALKVTLPSDALFDATQNSLRPEMSAILDSIISDLQRYPGATIQIAAHVDEQGTVDADRARTFEQSRAVKQYLASKLPNYQWVAIGYGHSRPLADNKAEADRQRNRRVEITVSP
jgi:OmpA-OmpF porin, OOP family